MNFISTEYSWIEQIPINTSYAMLSRGIPWNMPRVTCIFRIHTSLYYFIPCLNLWKIYGNFRKLRKLFKPIIEELYTKKIYENFGKSLAIFGNVWKTSETVINVFRCFNEFLKFSENLRKSICDNPEFRKSPIQIGIRLTASFQVLQKENKVSMLFWTSFTVRHITIMSSAYKRQLMSP